MANHRDEPGHRRTPSAATTSAQPASPTFRRRADRSAESTTSTGEIPKYIGRRRAERKRSRVLSVLPSPALAVGVAAMAVAVAGTVNSADPFLVEGSAGSTVKAATALNGTSGIGAVAQRGQAVSRDSARDARADAAGSPLTAAANALAKERAGELRNLAQKAESQADRIEANLWSLPVQGYRLTARFGEYGLWASYHTGLDFAAPSGTPLYAIANGTITSTGYDGSYGNKTVLTLEDGTEIWYCHQSAFGVSVGQEVRSGEPIGYVGSTGNSTGPHLHLEVRPGGGDPVDPYQAMRINGVQP